MKSKVKYKKRVLVKYWFIRHRIVSILLILLLGCVTYGVADHVRYDHKVAAERVQFAQAKADLDSLYNQIVAAVGQPLAHSSEQYCGRTSTEAFASPGALSCDTTKILIYSSDINIKAVTTALNNIFNSNKYFNLKDIELEDKDNISSKAFSLNSGIKCFYDLWFFSDNDLPVGKKLINTKLNNGYLLELSCGGGTLTNYYPLKQM